MVRVEVAAESVVLQPDMGISSVEDANVLPKTPESEKQPTALGQNERSIQQSDQEYSGDPHEKQSKTAAAEDQIAYQSSESTDEVKASKSEALATTQESEKEAVKLPQQVTESANNGSARQHKTADESNLDRIESQDSKNKHKTDHSGAQTHSTDDQPTNSSTSAENEQNSTQHIDPVNQAELRRIAEKEQVEAKKKTEEERNKNETKQKLLTIQAQKKQQLEQQKAEAAAKLKKEQEKKQKAELEQKRQREKEAQENKQREQAERLEKERKEKEEKQKQALEKQKKEKEAKEAKQREEKARLDKIANEKAAKEKGNQNNLKDKPKQVPPEPKPQAKPSTNENRVRGNNLTDSKNSGSVPESVVADPKPPTEQIANKAETQFDQQVELAVEVPHPAEPFDEVRIDKQQVPADAIEASLIDTADKKDTLAKTDQLPKSTSMLFILDTCYHSLKLLLCTNPYILLFLLACIALRILIGFLELLVSALTSEDISEERIVRFFSIIKKELEDGSKSLKSMKLFLPPASVSTVSNRLNQASSGSLPKRIDSLNASLKDIVADYKKYCPLFEKVD